MLLKSNGAYFHVNWINLIETVNTYVGLALSWKFLWQYTISTDCAKKKMAVVINRWSEFIYKWHEGEIDGYFVTRGTKVRTIYTATMRMFIFI